MVISQRYVLSKEIKIANMPLLRCGVYLLYLHKILKLPYQVTSTRMEKPSLSSFMAEVSRKEEREGNQRNPD